MARRRGGGQQAVGGFFLVVVLGIVGLGYLSFNGSIQIPTQSPSKLQEDAAAAQARADVSSANATQSAAVRQTEVAVYNEQRVVEVTRQAAEIETTQTATAQQAEATAGAKAEAENLALRGTEQAQAAVATMDSREATATAVVQAQVVADMAVKATQQALDENAAKAVRDASWARTRNWGLGIMASVSGVALLMFARITWVLNQRLRDAEEDIRSLQRGAAQQARELTRILEEIDNA